MAKQHRKKNSGNESVGSQQQLAAALAARGLKRTQQAIGKLMRSDGWAAAGLPTGFPIEPSRVDAIAAYITQLAAERNTGGAVAVEASKEKAAIIRSRRRLLDLKYQKERGKLISREESEMLRAKQWDAVRQALAQVPRAMRQVLADATDPAKVEAMLTEALMRVCNEGFGGADN